MTRTRERLVIAFALSIGIATQATDANSAPAASFERPTYVEAEHALRAVEAILAHHPGDRDGGIAIVDGSTVDVALVGAADGLETALRQAVPSRVLRLRTVRRPYSELLALTKRIAADQPALAARGVSMTSWGPDPATNTVSVGMDRTDLDAQALLRREYGEDLLTFRTEPPMTPYVGRAYDYAPWNGGDYIMGLNAAWQWSGCTSGPPVRSVNGVEYFITAAHCYPLGRNVYNTTSPGPSNHMGHVAWRDARTSNSTDTALVRADVSTLNWRSTSAEHQVSFSGRDYVGEQVCTSGAYNSPRYGGDVCGVVVTDVDRCSGSQPQVCGATFAQKSGWTVAREGDSGGPVYNVVSGGNLNVRGTIAGGRFPYLCPDGTVCSNDVVYVQISHTLDYWNVSLNTLGGG